LTNDITPQEPQTEQEAPMVIDAPWLASQVMAILYFIEFNYGEESAKALEETALSIEGQMRSSMNAGHS
jgi:hypothetical protein